MSGLKMAKADPEEFERVMSFVRVMEALFESRSFFSNEEDWREWDDDDEDKKMLLEIEKEVKEEDGTDWNGDADNRLILYEFIKRKWRQANFSGSFGRIIMDAEVLIDNACDPGLDYLEFKPEIKAAMEEYEKNRWISVEDNLPSKPYTVFVRHKDGYLEAAKYENGIWYRDGRIRQTVTHWMPIPELKEGGEK